MYVPQTAAITFSFSSACFFFYNYDLLQPPLSRPKARFISWYCAFKASSLMKSCLLNCLTNKKLLERSFRTILQPHVVNFSQKLQHVLWPFLLSDVIILYQELNNILQKNIKNTARAGKIFIWEGDFLLSEHGFNIWPYPNKERTWFL